MDLDGYVLSQGRFKNATTHDFARALQADDIASIKLVWVEKVASWTGQGVKSTWSFAHNAGMIEGVISTLDLRFEIVKPYDWQRQLGITSKVKNNKKRGIVGETTPQWKKRLKVFAQRLFPTFTLITDSADSLLIAEACRREYLARVLK